MVTIEKLKEKQAMYQQVADKLKNDAIANQGAADAIGQLIAELGQAALTPEAIKE